LCTAYIFFTKNIFKSQMRLLIYYYLLFIIYYLLFIIYYLLFIIYYIKSQEFMVIKSY